MCGPLAAAAVAARHTPASPRDRLASLAQTTCKGVVAPLFAAARPAGRRRRKAPVPRCSAPVSAFAAGRPMPARRLRADAPLLVRAKARWLGCSCRTLTLPFPAADAARAQTATARRATVSRCHILSRVSSVVCPGPVATVLCARVCVCARVSPAVQCSACCALGHAARHVSYVCYTSRSPSPRDGSRASLVRAASGSTLRAAARSRASVSMGKLQMTPEAQARFDEICQLLVAAGYFRARIPMLSPFDKVAGGIAWCMTAASADIDVDFQENATIGQKIKIGEAIERTLKAMKAPPLQAHQLQGLDFDAIFPVVQWLVKQ
eukprot:5055553-Prymnesium_polylepis.1